MKINPGLEDLKASLLQQLQSSSISKTGNNIPQIQESLAKVAAMQFPGSKQEEWKYSPFSIEKEAQFVLRHNHGKAAVRLSTDGLEDCQKIVFVDGFFVPTLSDLQEIQGLTIQSLAEKAEPFAQNLAGYEDTIFSHLNQVTALTGGISIEVAPKAVIKSPIVFVHLFSEIEQSAWVQPRIHIQIGERAEVSFAELWQNPSNQALVVNSLTQIHLASESMVRWLNFENWTANSSLINQTRAEVAAKAVFQHYVVAMGEGYIRNNLEIRINGKEGDAHMYGLSLGNFKFHVDHHTFVNHKAENTTSNQLYKSILSGKSNGVFNGKILVDQAAQKTNAYQSSKNILLSADAKVNAKPQLEIFADDVKCSHGATIGQLDEEPVFYLRSRGLDEATAKQLLLQAFAVEIFEKIDHPSLKNQIGQKVMDYMGSMLS